jgi:hypothetical protein
MYKKFVIAITSHRGSNLRDLCRSGWIKRWGNHPDIAWFFVVGNDYVAANTITEPNVVTLDCHDDYDRLPDKTRATFHYALSTYDFKYLVKCDEDSWLHIPRLLELEKLDKEYIGDNHGYRCRLWFKNAMHDYGHGGAGYIVSKRAARLCIQNMSTGHGGCEDLIVGWLMKKYNIPLHDEPRLQFDFKDELVPKPTNEMISSHYINTLERLNTIEKYWD